MTHHTKNDGIPSQEDTQSEALVKQKGALPQHGTEAEPEITREQLTLGKRWLHWRTMVPLVAVMALLIFFAHKVNFDPQQTWNAIRTANVIFFLAAFAIYYLSFPVRALRWRILLGNVGFVKANARDLPKFWKLIEIIYLSWFVNLIVPAKLGDLYRAYLLRQHTSLPASRSFGTVLAERLLDLIVLLLLFIPAAMLSLHESVPPQLLLVLKITMAGVLIGIIGLFMLRLLRERLAVLVPARLRNHFHHFQQGILGSFRRLPTLTGLTLGIWLCESLRFFFIALSLNLIGGNVAHIVTVSCFIALGEALLTVVPFTGGGVGLVEGGMLAMILLFTQGKPHVLSLSAAAILLDRTIGFFSVLAIGFVLFAFCRRTTKRPMADARPAKNLQEVTPL